jgi:hypothetical protein
VSISRIGRNGIRPLVLMDLGTGDQEVLARILYSAETHLDQTPAVKTMIAVLREAADLPKARALAKKDGQAP